MRTIGAAHYVGRNHATTLPRRFVYLDSEARQVEVGTSRRQTLRLAVVGFQTRSADDDAWSTCRYATCRSGREIWENVVSVTRAKARTVVVAHNLAYDLRITDALTQLPALGWEMKRINIGNGRSWATFGNGNRTLALVDSMSWVPYPLGELASMVGMRKCDLPAWNDTEAAWEQRCRTDVDILAEVWRRLMDWVSDNDLGQWRVTGAGQSWSAFRHRFMHDELLVHDDERARDAERQATYAGRCEAWRHGKCANGPFSEWDFTGAYAAVGRDDEVPVRLHRHHGALDLGQWADLRISSAVLARVSVTTAEPTLPVVFEGRIVWPVGTFNGCYWDNEIDLAITNGASVTIHEAWVYDKASALHDFCKWVLELIDERNTSVEPIVKLMLKHWSRALIGRFGARWPQWANAGTVSDPHVRRWQDLNGDTGERTEWFQLGHRMMTSTEVRDAPDCMPQIMSYVVAACRVRLWNAAKVAGFEHVMYLDTDSIITDRVGTERLRNTPVDGLRIKRAFRSLEVLGPRQYIADGAVRAAGLPRNATKVGKRSFIADTWRTLDTSLRHGEHDSVVVSKRRSELRATDRRRVHLPGGHTEPIALSEA